MPHKRTYDFICSLYLHGFRDFTIIAREYEVMTEKRWNPEDKFDHIVPMTPHQMSISLNLNYMEGKYDAPDFIEKIRGLRADIGVIASAFKLSPDFISCFSTGIINFHPGILPYNRGLGAVKRAVLKDIPQGLTIHFIDHRIDAGKIIKRYVVRVKPYYTLRDINLKIHELQVKLLPHILTQVMNKNVNLVEVPPVGIPPLSRYPDVPLSPDDIRNYCERWHSQPLMRCACGSPIKNNTCLNCNAKFTEVEEGIFEMR